jgi:hypothetical protein
MDLVLIIFVTIKMVFTSAKRKQVNSVQTEKFKIS